MNVSEVLAKDLNREIKVDVPRDNIEDKLLSKLEELKNTVQLKGFRPGKVPISYPRADKRRRRRGHHSNYSRGRYICPSIYS